MSREDREDAPGPESAAAESAEPESAGRWYFVITAGCGAVVIAVIASALLPDVAYPALVLGVLAIALGFGGRWMAGAPVSPFRLVLLAIIGFGAQRLIESTLTKSRSARSEITRLPILPPGTPPTTAEDEEPAEPAAIPDVPRSSDILPMKDIEWELPDRAMTKRERALMGTWIAKQDASGTELTTISGSMLLDTKGLPSDTLGLLEGVLRDKRIPTGCVWMELRDDFRGHRSACALAKGEPNALEAKNPMTGEARELGVDFEWYLEKNVVKIHTAADLVVQRVGDAGTQRLRFRHWHLKMLDDDRIEERLPEHDYVLPTRARYLVSED